MIKRRDCCRGCASTDMKMVLRLSASPIGDHYVNKKDLSIIQPKYPMDLYLCFECGLAQIIDIVDPEFLYNDYIYETTSSESLMEHFSLYADRVIEKIGLDEGGLVLDIGCNDGVLLRQFKKRGRKVLGVEPAVKIAENNNDSGIDTVQGFFTSNVVGSIIDDYGYPDLVTSNNVVANIDDLIPFLLNVREIIKDDGVFVFESYYLLSLIENKVFDFLYHEHLTSFSVRPVKSIIDSLELDLVSVEKIDTKGGSMRYYVQLKGGKLQSDGSVDEAIRNEVDYGLYTEKVYQDFGYYIDEVKVKIINALMNAKLQGKVIVGFGASITCTTLMNEFSIDKYFDFLVDDNASKQGLYSPHMHIPVHSPNFMKINKPDVLVVLAWRFADDIRERYPEYFDSAECIIIPLPVFDSESSC